MAHIPRTTSIAPPSNVVSGRLPGGPRSVAVGDGVPVEETSSQEMVLFSDALLYQEEEPMSRQRRDRNQGAPSSEYAGTSQAFAAMFEEGNASGPSGNVQNARPRRFANVISRAIKVYETNVKVIQGLSEQRGQSVSLSL